MIPIITAMIMRMGCKRVLGVWVGICLAPLLALLQSLGTKIAIKYITAHLQGHLLCVKIWYNSEVFKRDVA